MKNFMIPSLLILAAFTFIKEANADFAMEESVPIVLEEGFYTGKWSLNENSWHHLKFRVLDSQCGDVSLETSLSNDHSNIQELKVIWNNKRYEIPKDALEKITHPLINTIQTGCLESKKGDETVHDLEIYILFKGDKDIIKSPDDYFSGSLLLSPSGALIVSKELN